MSNWIERFERLGNNNDSEWPHEFRRTTCGMNSLPMDTQSEVPPKMPISIGIKPCLAAFIPNGADARLSKLLESTTLLEAHGELDRAHRETGQFVVIARDERLKILFSSVGDDLTVLIELLPLSDETEVVCGGMCSLSNAREFLDLVFDGVSSDRLWLLLEPLVISLVRGRDTPHRDGEEASARLAIPFTYGEALSLLD